MSLGTTVSCALHAMTAINNTKNRASIALPLLVPTNSFLEQPSFVLRTISDRQKALRRRKNRYRNADDALSFSRHSQTPKTKPRRDTACQQISVQLLLA